MNRYHGNILFLADVPLMKPASGAEKVLHHQAVGLHRAGRRVLALTRRNGSGPDLIRDVDGVAEACYAVQPFQNLAFLCEWMRKSGVLWKTLTANHPVRLAVCHQPFTTGGAILTGKLAKIPVLYVFHSPSHEEFQIGAEHVGSVGKLGGILVRRAMEYCCLRKARRIVTLSRFMQNRIKKIHRINGSRMNVIPGGVDLERFTPPHSRAAAKCKLGLPPDRVHLLTVRNLEPRMGLDNLLQAIAIVKNRGYSVHLTVGGSGPEAHRLQLLIESLGLRGDVRMAGFIPEHLLPEYYGAADFFILPTRSLEGFGLVTIESMACGTPVLGTPVGATPEILSPLDCRLIFSGVGPDSMAEGIAANIARFYKFAERFSDLKRRCREYTAANYSWDCHISALISVIDALGSGEIA